MDIHLKDIDISFLKNIPKNMALSMLIIPIKEENDIVYIYTDEITNEKIDYTFLVFNKEVKFIKGDKEKIISLINICYGDNDLDDKYGYSIDNKFKSVIKKSIEYEASDIHVEPQETCAYIRVRVDGILRLIDKVRKEDYNSLISKIKLEGGMDIGDKLRPQDGKLSFKYENGRVYDLRISSLPTGYGEKIVLRILYKNVELIDINRLNFTTVQRDKINKLLLLNHGIVLVTGPTGSGKSTTLYALLNNINNEGVNISTIEDPIEFNISGINQTNVNEKVGLNFLEGLKYILRQDPDVILIGEIRDEETAKMSIRAAITGHKVYSTIHTNNGYEVFNRLKDMGVEEYLITSALKGVISQRLVRKLCVKCKEINILSKELKNKYRIENNSMIYKAVGCESCGWSGYKGRTMVCEVLTTDDYFNSNIDKNEHGKQMLESCRSLLNDGIVSLEEYLLLKQGEEISD